VVDQHGNLVEEIAELWHRNPVEIVQDLLGNPSFKAHQAYSPRRVYRSRNRQNREYSEAWTADWWWNLQVRQL
jgi:hypothetical protein